MNRLCALLTSLWLGMQVMAGYIAAPILFERLGKQEAGNIAGMLFSINNYFGLLAWTVAWLVVRSTETVHFRQLQSSAEIHYPPSAADRVQPIPDKPCYRSTQDRYGKLAAFVIGRLFRYVARHFQHHLSGMQRLGLRFAVALFEI